MHRNSFQFNIHLHLVFPGKFLQIFTPLSQLRVNGENMGLLNEHEHVLHQRKQSRDTFERWLLTQLFNHHSKQNGHRLEFSTVKNVQQHAELSTKPAPKNVFRFPTAIPQDVALHLKDVFCHKPCERGTKMAGSWPNELVMRKMNQFT